MTHFCKELMGFCIARGDFVLGGFWLGGILSGGIFSGGILAWGDFVLSPIIRSENSVFICQLYF